MTTQVHIDLVGGLAGDMFAAALIDADPTLEAAVMAALADFSTAADRLWCCVPAHADGTLVGRRFDVGTEVVQRSMAPHSPSLPLHGHVTWMSIRQRIAGACLPAGTIRHALGIFQLLAEAEAAVHGIPVDSVEFHEVGAWDSIADIIAAATLIDKLQAARWTCSAVPLGGGRVSTQHGILPLPAPATARLLLGFATVDDGIGGERVTPTGAAILRHLCPPEGNASGPCHSSRKLSRMGVGFGKRVLPGISNCTRVLLFETAAAPESEARRQIHVLQFEVDDQSGEDLAAGLDRIRATPGVLDVTQSVAVGKKGRMAAHVQVLARAAPADAVIAQCFRETTTIGLRRHVVEGIGLARSTAHAVLEGQEFRVKIVERPGGKTAKTEADDVLAHAGHAQRARLRTQAESAVLDQDEAPVDA